MQALTPNCVLLDVWAQVAASFEALAPLAQPFSLERPYQSVVAATDDAADDDAEPAGEAEADAVEPAGEAAAEPEGEAEANAPRRKKRRRRTKPLNEAEQDANARHAAIAPLLEDAAREVAEWRQASGAASVRAALGVVVPPGAEPAEEEQEEQAPDWVAMQQPGMLRALRPRFEWLDVEGSGVQGGAAGTAEAGAQAADDESSGHLFNRLVSNPSARERLAAAAGHAVVIPRASTFLMSDVKRLGPLAAAAEARGGFHCILADPPWENRSAARGQRYGLLPARNLLALPLRALMPSEGGCLVALWVTNRERLRRFVDAELLPAWGLRQVAAWYWLKVTDAGLPASRLDVAHRRPYETLLLCWPTDQPLPPAPDFQPAQAKAGVAATGAEETGSAVAADAAAAGVQHFRLPPERLVLAAVPAQHSRKPHLGALLSPYLPAQPRCLELFARELAAGWTSWGNECLRHQSRGAFYRPATQ